MVHAVHLEQARPHQVCQPRSLGDEYLVRQVVASERLPAKGEVIVLQRARKLLGEILIQRPAGRHVDELHAAAHAEHRLALLERPPRERHLDAIALAIGPVAERMRIGAVRRGVDVGTTRQEDGVQAIIDAAQRVVVDERHEPWDGARRGERQDVPLAHHPRGRNVRRYAPQALERLGGNSDDGPARALCDHDVTKLPGSAATNPRRA